MANQSAMINNYNSSVYNAQQARSGAIIGGALGAVGSIGGGFAQGAAIAACWVAREVYGVHNPAWLVFRTFGCYSLVRSGSVQFTSTSVKGLPSSFGISQD